MDNRDLEKWLREVAGDVKETRKLVTDMQIACAGRCGIIREACRLLAALIAGALAALGFKS